MTPLLLLPGMMCDARLFTPQIDAFSGSRPLMTVPLDARDSIGALATDILSFAPEHFAMAGLSMGGIVAMEVLRQAPHRVLGLALMDTNPLAETPEAQARREPQIDAARHGGLARVMAEEMKPNYLADGPHRAAILDLCMSMALDLGPDAFVRQSLALRNRQDQTETLRRFSGPAVVICGREDKLCPIERHTLMHELMPRSHLHVIEGAGHLPTLEQPDAINGILSHWMADL